MLAERPAPPMVKRVHKETELIVALMYPLPRRFAYSGLGQIEIHIIQRYIYLVIVLTIPEGTL